MIGLSILLFIGFLAALVDTVRQRYAKEQAEHNLHYTKALLQVHREQLPKIAKTIETLRQRLRDLGETNIP